MFPSLDPRGSQFRIWILALLVMMASILGYHLLEEVQIAGSPPSPDWSKHLTVGMGDLNTQVAIDLLPDGTVLMAWPRSEGLQVAMVGKDGKLKKTALLPFPLASNARIIAGDPSYLLWIDGKTRMLHRGLLDLNNLQLQQREVLAAGVPAFATAVNPRAKKAYILIGTGNGVSVYTNAPRLEQAAGIKIPAVASLDARFDLSGRLHLVAASKGGLFHYDLYYASLPVTGPAPKDQAGSSRKEKPKEPKEEVQVARVSTISTLGSVVLGNIQLGLDEKNAYLFFGKETFSRYIPATNVFFLSFPLDRPPATAVTPAKLPFDWRLVQTASQMVVKSIANPSPAGGQGKVLKVALAANVFKTRSKTGMEIVVVDFAGGKPIKACLASKATGASFQPRIIRGGEEFYLGWVETAGFGQYKINMAATSAGFKRTLNSFARGDFANAALNSLLNLFSIFFALFYIVGAWLPTFIWIFGCYFFALNWAERNQGIVLGVAMAVYLVSKLWSMQYFIYTPPVRAMMPGWMATPLASYLIPAFFVALAAAGVAFLRGQNRLASIPPTMAFLAVIDTLLTLMLYAPYMR
ncbi:MAG: hypothetical protein M1379_12920 [Firmicutes bacterium]|nr:hypothetical protein [Bacillota bacterium]